MYAPLQNVNTWNASLEELNGEEVKTLIPTIIYTSLLMVCGVIGNALVLYVYCFRFKASNHRYFILTLGFCDFITCAVCMPFLIADELLPFMFTNTIVCKSLRYVTYNTAIVSIFTLFVIGVERYKKICQPLDKQITLPLARRILFVIVLLTCTIFALPAFILYGNTSIYTGYRNVTGVACFIDDRYRDTPLPVAYNTTLFTIVFVLGSAMVYCYSKIAHQRLIRAKLKNARKRYCIVENSENYFISDRSGNDVHTSTLNGLMEEFNETIKEQGTQTHNSVVQKLNSINEHNNQPSTENSNMHYLELNKTSNESSEEHNIGTIQLGNKARNSENGMHGSKINHINKFENTSRGADLCKIIHRNRNHNLHVNGGTLLFDPASSIPADVNAKTANGSNNSISVPPAALTGCDNQLDISPKCTELDSSTVNANKVKNDIDYVSKSDQNLFISWRSQTESSSTKAGLKILSDSCVSGKGFTFIKKKRTRNFSDTLIHRIIDNKIYDKKHALSCDNFDLVFTETDQHDKTSMHVTTFTTEDIPKHINQNKKESPTQTGKICPKHSNSDMESDIVSDLPQDGLIADSDLQHNMNSTTGTTSVTKRNQIKCQTNETCEEKGADTILLNGNISKLKISKVHQRCRKAFVKRNETKSAKYAQNRDMSLIRVTKMLFVITLVYFISFMPHLVLMIVLMLDEQFLLSLDHLNAAVYYIALRSFLINSVANPFIYNFMDIKFRKECQKLCRRNK